MQLYSYKKPASSIGRIQHRAIPAPLGAVIPANLIAAVNELVEEFSLPQVGVLTPWAQRDGEFGWTEVVRPDTNIAIYGIHNDEIRATDGLTGQPMPFLAVLTTRLPSVLDLERLTAGSAYEPYETQAVYRQDDKKPIPDIQYLHWLSRRAQGEDGGEKEMEAVATDLGGDLLFAQQIPFVAQRETPAVPFKDALNSQLSLQQAAKEAPVIAAPIVPTAPPLPPLTNPPVVPSTQQLPASMSTPSDAPVAVPAAKPSWIGPALVGVGVAAATVLIYKAVKK